MTHILARFALPAIGLIGVMLHSPVAAASSSSGADEYLAVTEGVPPNILFVLDMSSDMDDYCDADKTKTCMEIAVESIGLLVQHYDWARYGVIGTSKSDSISAFHPIVPIGSSYAEFSGALSSLTTHTSGSSSISTRNLAEVLASMSTSYLTTTKTEDDVDDDLDGFIKDWDESPIQYSCQDTHIIVITNGRPSGDSSVPPFWRPDISAMFGETDYKCDSSGVSLSDKECLFDQTVYQLRNWDLRTDLADSQYATTHILDFDRSSDTVAAGLYANAVDVIDNDGIYSVVSGESDQFMAEMLELMSEIRSGFYASSTPTISAEGDYLIYSFYEIDGSDPLAEGHVRAYRLDEDPTSATYGQILYESSSTYDGAVWDGGTLLVSRLVTSTERNEEDRDGIGRRDIYTFFEEGAALLHSESVNDRRQGFDVGFVTAIGTDATALDLIMDTTVSSTDPSCAQNQSYDLNDDCQVDDQDLQALVDFARGYAQSTFRYIDQERGTWKLGDSPNAVPVVVDVDDDIYSINSVYRKFLQELRASNYPSIVLLPANDGMLHAFRLEDDVTTSATEEGEELWAWIPGYLLYREHDSEWAGRLIDQMLYGRTFLFDGTPVVEDVWIDLDGDGAQSCVAVPDACEWRRIVVVQQGQGGPVTLALDITDPTTPTFLWEQTDETDPTAMGYTVGRPVIDNIYDTSGGPSVDRYVVMWGSGRGVPYATSENYYETAEGNLYMWAVGDDYWGSTSAGIQDAGDGVARGDNGHPESATYGVTLDTDLDKAGHYEYAYISAALSVLDVDSDGDIDTVYFPITASYTPRDELGSGPGDISDPGSTWMYKACINPKSPGELDWVEFYDPVDDGGLPFRPEIYYAATTAWHSDGSLGIYWGTGSPYGRDSARKGYLFAMRDNSPMSCTSDSMSAITDCNGTGLYPLEPGETLTGDPIVYAGVVYFSTWVPEVDRCDGGKGRLYGINFEDCTSGLDTDDSGFVDSSDADYIEHDDTRLSSPTVTDKGTIIVATSDGSDTDLEVIEAMNDPFLGTTNIAWMEVF
jgi:hypothetical protein